MVKGRGLVPDLVTPVPMLQRLPGVLQDDKFIQKFVLAFDDAYAPIINTLDALAAYVDPWLAPVDFLDWLAGWVGVDLDDSWTVEQRRRIISEAALVHRRRGTVRGIEEALALGLGAMVTVTDSGGCTWSARPGAEPPGGGPARIVVRLIVDDPAAVDRRRVEALIESVKPAHVAHTTEIVGGGKGAKKASPPKQPAAPAAPRPSQASTAPGAPAQPIAPVAPDAPTQVLKVQKPTPTPPAEPSPTPPPPPARAPRTGPPIAPESPGAGPGKGDS